MATVYLDSNEKITVFGPARVYGSTGVETVFISGDARGVFLSPAVERADFAGSAGDYQFRGAAGQVEIWQGGELVASIPATGSGGTEARFADGAATISVNPATGDVLLGGRVLGTTAAPVDIPLDPSRPSDPAVNPTPTPDPDPDPTPDPDPDPDPTPDPEPGPAPTPTPDPWDDPWFWPTPTPPSGPGGSGGSGGDSGGSGGDSGGSGGDSGGSGGSGPTVKNPLYIEDATSGSGNRTLTGNEGTATIFALVDAKSGGVVDELTDLTIIGRSDNDTLKIRADQEPKEVTNVENVEVTSTDTDNEFDAVNFTGLKKITVNSGNVDGEFVISYANGASTIVAGDTVKELSVTGQADGATIEAGAARKVTVNIGIDGGAAAVNSAADNVVIDAGNLTGTLTVSLSGSTATVTAGKDAIIEAGNLSDLLTLGYAEAFRVRNATKVNVTETSTTLILEGDSPVEVNAKDGGSIDASGLSGDLTVTGTGEADQSVMITTASDATVNLDAGTSDSDTPAIEATIDASAGAATITGGSGSETVKLAEVPGGTFTFNGGDGDDTLSLDAEMTDAVIVFNGGGTGDDDKLVVNEDVTLGAGSSISNVEKVTVDSSKILTVENDTAFDATWVFELSGNLAVTQTSDSLNLSGITKDMSGTAAIEITGTEVACDITLGSDDGIVETITIKTAGAEGDLDGADAPVTTITGFNKETGDGPVDRLVFTGKNTEAAQFYAMDDGTFAELITKVKDDAGDLDVNKVYFGAYDTDNISFAIMKDIEDNIFAVKLLEVSLSQTDTGIFVGA